MKYKAFKKSSTGAVLEWSIEVVGNQYRTTTGHVDGSLVISEWTTAEGKNTGRANETTPEQQALLEAGSKYKKKLEQEGYFKTIADINNKRSFFEPMLAQKYEGKRKDDVLKSFPVFSQGKLDGIRCVYHEGQPKSRKGKPFVTVPHITEVLQELFDRYPDLTLDGELYNHDYRDDFNTLTSVIKSQKPTSSDLERAKEIVQYHVYDCFIESRPELTFGQRIAFLQDNLPVGELVKLVDTDQCLNEKELDYCNGEYVAAGYEGQMVRLDERYEFEKRSRFLLKRKDFMDDEYEIVSIEEGKGNRSGMAGRITYRLPDGREFGSGIRGGFSFYKQLWDDRDILKGKQGTVRFQCLTPDGIPRFPVTVAIRDYE